MEDFEEAGVEASGVSGRSISSVMLINRTIATGMLYCTVDPDYNVVKISVHVPVYVYPYQP
jgi:hypothetical protein